MRSLAILFTCSAALAAQGVFVPGEKSPAAMHLSASDPSATSKCDYSSVRLNYTTGHLWGCIGTPPATPVWTDLTALGGGGGGGGGGAFSGANSVWLYDDFLSNQTVSALGWSLNGGAGNWYPNNGIIAQNNHPGNRDLQAGSGNWVYHKFGNDNGGSTAYLSVANSTVIQGEVIADAFSYENNSGRSGFGWWNNTGSLTPTNAVWFCFDNAANGNNHWWAYVVNSGTATRTDTGVVAHGVWHTLEIDTAGTAATFKIDGAQVATGTFSADTYNPGFFVYGNAGGQTDLGFDWFAAQLNFSR